MEYDFSSTLTGSKTFRRGMRVALRHDASLMPQDALDRVQIHALLYKPGCQRMSHIVKPEIWNTGPISRSAKLAYQITDF